MKAWRSNEGAMGEELQSMYRWQGETCS